MSRTGYYLGGHKIIRGPAPSSKGRPKVESKLIWAPAALETELRASRQGKRPSANPQSRQSGMDTACAFSVEKE